MNIFAIISLIAFMICFFLGNFIYHKNPKSRLNRIIAILSILVGFLAFVEFGYRQAETIQTAFFWLKLSTLFPFVPALLLHISLVFTESRYLKNKLTYLSVYTPAIILSALGLTTNILIADPIKQSWGWFYTIPTDPMVYYFFSIWTISVVGLAGLIVLFYYQKSDDIKRKQAKFIFAGLYLPFILSLVSDVILPSMSISIPEMTITMITIGIVLISYGIWKYRFPALSTAIAADEIVSTMSNFFILIDDKSNIRSVNPAAYNLFGYERNELVGKPIDIIFPTEEMLKLLEILSIKENRRAYITNIKSNFKAKNGNHIPVFLSLSLIKSNSNDILGITCVGSDITDIKEAEDKLKNSLKEKELLLQEVHHRVKNNLQIISSLLNLQSSYIKDAEYFEIFKESQSRVKSMAFIHEQLYKSSDFSKINFANYIRNLLSYLSFSHDLDHDKIKIDLNVEDAFLDINTAIPCGLIINELVTNSIKYAFPDGRSGKIAVDLYVEDEDKYVLKVNDNGVGLSGDIDFQNTETLGLQLVNNLTKQLEGSIKLNMENGTKFTIIFSKLDYKERI